MADKRRQYGTGSVYQRGDGKWVGTLEAGWTPQGKRRRVTVIAATEKDAQAKLRKKQRAIAEEGLGAATQKKTVKSWSDQWLPIKEATMRPDPYANVASHVQRWIVPTIGDRQLAQLSPAHARKVTDALRAAGRSGYTIRAVDSTLRSLIKDARIEGHHVPPGITEMDRPQVGESTRDAIPEKHITALLRAADETDPTGGGVARWLVGLGQGLRQAEVLGLTWDRVDLTRGLIDVSWQLKEVTPGKTIPDHIDTRHLVGRYWLMQPKTRAGVRVIPLAPIVHETLKRWRDVAPDNPWGLVFPGRHRDGTIMPRRDTADRQAWKALQLKAEAVKAWGPPKKPGGKPEPIYWDVHEMRHTTVTLLVALGVEPMIAEAILGQKELVRAYVHLKAEHARPAVTGLDTFLTWKTVTETSPAGQIDPPTVSA